MTVPEFGIGEVKLVLDYARLAISDFCQRIGIRTEPLQHYFMEALRANAARLQESLNQSFVPWCEESRQLLNVVEQLLIRNVSVSNVDYLDEALRFLASGGDVLVVSNHTSGADTLVLDFVANGHSANNAAYDWTYMAGHVVNVFLLPLAVAGGVNRLQIFSTRHLANVDEDTKARWRRQNIATMRKLGQMIQEGGKCVVLYPEGGRGEAALLPGDPGTMQIPWQMAKSSSRDLMVLPSYVVSTGILPVRRGPNEFNEFLLHAQPGAAQLSFGQPILWQHLQPKERLPNGELKRYLLGEVMACIADLAPTVDARGPHLTDRRRIW